MESGQRRRAVRSGHTSTVKGLGEAHQASDVPVVVERGFRRRDVPDRSWNSASGRHDLALGNNFRVVSGKVALSPVTVRKAPPRAQDHAGCKGLRAMEGIEAAMASC